MMDFTDITNQLLQQDVKISSDAISKLIHDQQVKIIELVKGLDPVLTNGSHDIRLRGVELLVNVVISLPTGFLSEKEIQVLSEFLCLRLIDHKTMEPITLKCLSFFIDCYNKPAVYNKNIVEFIKTKTTVSKMDVKTRHQVYDIMRKIIIQRHQINRSIDSDLIYSFIQMIEGESNPDNLLMCFGIVLFILKNFSDLEPYIDDIFEWLESYYPLDYAPQDIEAVSVQRSDLIRAFYDCFYASPLNADNLQTMLLERLDSNLTSTKLESLNCLVKCYEVFPLESIKNYASTLWTSIRMICLKKPGQVHASILEACFKTLSALARKLSEDGELYFNFVSDMYEEMAIAFRKPEMDLFEPAAMLLTHAVLPSIVGFNYVLSRMLPLIVDVLNADKVIPLPALSYIFEHLHKYHPDSELKSELSEDISKLAIAIVDKINANGASIRTLNALVRARVNLDRSTIDTIVEKLWSGMERNPTEIEQCMALICLNFSRLDLIINCSLDCRNLTTLMSLIDVYAAEIAVMQTEKTSQFPKFLVYLRLVLLRLDLLELSPINEIGGHVYENFLTKTRKLAIEFPNNPNLIEKIAQIHAIVFNKLDSTYLDPILIEYFSSCYCQNLVPSSEDGRVISSNVYLPMLAWVFRSLIVRNHHLAVPLVNLLLNFVTSESIDLELALEGCKLFNFVLSDDIGSLSFEAERHYQIFALYKQKFYYLTSKEIKVRYEMQKDELRKDLLLCSIASEVPNLPFAVYKKDRDWLLRKLLGVISSIGVDGNNTDTNEKLCENREKLLDIVYCCIESFLQKDSSADLSSFLISLVKINLEHARIATTMRLRKRALACLAQVTKSFAPSDLLALRSIVIDGLKQCLADKKRLVRQAAAEARLKWVLIGQPIGS